MYSIYIVNVPPLNSVDAELLCSTFPQRQVEVCSQPEWNVGVLIGSHLTDEGCIAWLNLDRESIESWPFMQEPLKRISVNFYLLFSGNTILHVSWENTWDRIQLQVWYLVIGLPFIWGKFSSNNCTILKNKKKIEKKVEPVVRTNYLFIFVYFCLFLKYVFYRSWWSCFQLL